MNHAPSIRDHIAYYDANGDLFALFSGAQRHDNAQAFFQTGQIGDGMTCTQVQLTCRMSLVPLSLHTNWRHLELQGDTYTQRKVPKWRRKTTTT